MDAQEELYKQLILEHNKKPRNFGELEHPTHTAEGFNPLCGDHLWVYLVCNDQEIITEVRFKGEGCAISRASASLMGEAVKGKSATEALKLVDAFNLVAKGEAKGLEELALIGKLKIFSGISQYPARVKCAVLAWHTLKAALIAEKKVSTE